MTVVKGLRGKVDFYFQRGRQVCRSWPRKSNLVPTVNQKPQRDAFRLISYCQKNMGPLTRLQWRAWQPHRGQTWCDFVHRVWLGPALAGVLVPMWDFTAMTIFITPTRELELRLSWNPSIYPSVPEFDVFHEDTVDDFGLWDWTIFDYKIQRGRFRQPRWQPLYGSAVRTSAHFFDPLSGAAHFKILRVTHATRFCVLLHSFPDDHAPLGPCFVVRRP